MFAEHRFLVPVIICLFSGYWRFLTFFMAMYVIDWEPIRRRWETDRLPYNFHIFRHGVIAKGLWSLLLYVGLQIVSEAGRFKFVFLLACLTWSLVLLLWLLGYHRERFIQKEQDQNVAGSIIGSIGVFTALLTLPHALQMTPRIFFIAFVFVFEWILIVRHVAQYQKGLKAPARPR